MKLLVLNCGSSSLKYKLFEGDDLQLLAAGLAERIGQDDSLLHNRWRRGDGTMGGEEYRGVTPDHRAALEHLFADLAREGVLADRGELQLVAHRVVHGGERFRTPARLDEAAVEAIRALVPLAPLHNPANLLGIELAASLCPGVAQLAVFDTAFHQGLPPHAYRYALPEWTYREQQVRRYGFHGTSVAYVARRAAQRLGQPPQSLNLIVLHLGNGASATAVQGGRSVDTSMGMTPLEGLVMGTRAGDLDPGVPFYLMRNAKLTAVHVEHLLLHEAGLRGMTGVADMREVHALAADGNQQAELALDLVAYRLKKYIGAYTAVLGRLDALVFTAGIGEHDADIRERACAGLGHLGIELDPARNDTTETGERDIASEAARVRVLVIPTDEEWEIARTALEFLHAET